MLVQKLRKDGDKFVMIITEEEAAQQGWHEDDLIELNKVQDTQHLPPEIEAAYKWSRERYTDDYVYLADH